MRGVDGRHAASRPSLGALLAFLLVPVAASSSAGGTDAQADFSYEGPSALQGSFQGVCEGHGISFIGAAQRAIDVESEGGRLLTRRITVNETRLLGGTSPVATPPEASIESQSRPLGPGRVAISWASEGTVVGLPLQEGEGRPSSFDVAWTLSRANASAVQAAPDTPAGVYWIETPEGPRLQPSHFPGWVRSVSWEGNARVEGGLTLYLRQVSLDIGADRIDLGPYVVERDNVTAPGMNRRTLELSDAFLHVPSARFDLPEGAQAVCRSMRGTLDGDFVATQATGVAEASTGPVSFERQVLSMRGRFDLEESPEDLPLESDSPGRMAGRARGSLAIVGVDFAPVARAPITGAAPAVAAGLAAALFAWILFKKGGLVVGVLYSRFGRDAALNNANRSLLYEAVRSDPGVELTSLARIASLHLSTVVYHVQVLRRVGLVTTHRRGRSVHVFVPAAGAPFARPTTLAARDERVAHLLALLRDGPLPQRALAEQLRDRFAVTLRAAYFMIERAVDAGTVERFPTPEGVSLRCATTAVSASAPS